MKVLFYPTIEQADRDRLQGADVVIVDVLRMGSTLVAALENGAKKIIHVADAETASRLALPAGRSTKLLAGERGGILIEGFDLGNSPLEYTAGAVGGKTIIITTTNGTRAVRAAAKSRRIIVCSINNVGAVADAVRDSSRLVILCCGTGSSIAAEDILCGGMLLAALGGGVREEELDDAARMALSLARETGDEIEAFLRVCDSGRRLLALGFGDDIVHCARRDISGVVPEVRQGAIL
jgi:2-phosphosulfolactate phosphatase